MDQEKQELSPEALSEAKIKALHALQNKASHYKIDVQDSSMLPDNLQGKKKLEFTIKPPTVNTLAKLAEVVETIPPEVMGAQGMTKEVLEHLPKLTKMLAILMHGSSRKEMPGWYEEFLAKNVTTSETLMLWQETAMKLDTSFFLPFIQSARLINPMQMNKPSETKRIIGSTPGPSLEEQ